MLGMAVFYTPDPAKEPDGLLEPRMYDVTVEQAVSLCAGYLVMWIPEGRNELFGTGFKTPSPYCRFFYRGREIVNPWSLYRVLPERPDRNISPILGDNREAGDLFGKADF